MSDKSNSPVGARPRSGTPKPVRRKTPEMQRIVEQGYQMSLDDARRILADWEKDSQRWPLQMVQNARAMIAAYETDPVAVSTRPGWKREKRKYAGG